MRTESLTDENFLILCAKYYRNPQCGSTEEFLNDLQHIKYIKKLLTRYTTKGHLDERLILNHIIILNNVFGPEFLCRILFLKLITNIKQIKPFLLYLNVLPDIVELINGYDYDTLSIEMDWNVVERLRAIDRSAKVG